MLVSPHNYTWQISPSNSGWAVGVVCVGGIYNKLLIGPKEAHYLDKYGRLSKRSATTGDVSILDVWQEGISTREIVLADCVEHVDDFQDAESGEDGEVLSGVPPGEDGDHSDAFHSGDEQQDGNDKRSAGGAPRRHAKTRLARSSRANIM